MEPQEQLEMGIRDRDALAIELALSKGADLSQRDASGETPMMRIVWEHAKFGIPKGGGFSADSGGEDFYDMLVQHGGELSEKDKKTLKEWADHDQRAAVPNRALLEGTPGERTKSPPLTSPLENALKVYQAAKDEYLQRKEAELLLKHEPSSKRRGPSVSRSL